MNLGEISLEIQSGAATRAETPSRFRAALGFGQKESMALHPVSGDLSQPGDIRLDSTNLPSSFLLTVFAFQKFGFQNGFNLAWF